MLEFESKENNVFLNLDGLDDPFNYKIDMFNKDKEKIADRYRSRQGYRRTFC